MNYRKNSSNDQVMIDSRASNDNRTIDCNAGRPQPARQLRGPLIPLYFGPLCGAAAALSDSMLPRMTKWQPQLNLPMRLPP